MSTILLAISPALYKELRGEWLIADPERPRPDGALRRECLVLLVPAGITLQPAAWLTHFEAVLIGRPSFWKVRRKGEHARRQPATGAQTDRRTNRQAHKPTGAQTTIDTG